MKTRRNKHIDIDFLPSIEDQVSTSFRKEVDLNLQILERINFLLNKKFGGVKKLLAQKMGKAEPQISKYFSGYQNFTLQTILELEEAFGEQILCVCRDGEEESIGKQYDYVLVDGEKKNATFIEGSFTQEKNIKIEELAFDEF